MVTPKYQLGQKVWWARTEAVGKTRTCPDCLGTRCVTVVLADYQCFSIPCETCDHMGRFHGPQGYIKYREHVEYAEETEIRGVELTRDGITYRTSKSYLVIEDQVYSTAEEANEHAARLAKERTKEEENKVYQKQDNHKRWAWHVRYYRNQIKEAQETISRATAKLNYAKTKTKEN